MLSARERLSRLPVVDRYNLAISFDSSSCGPEPSRRTVMEITTVGVREE
jgi:hypothetical protein